MKTSTIKLSTPVEIHDRPVTEITLREPTGGQYLDFGEPLILVNSSGGLFQTEDRAAIGKYLDACVEHDSGVAVLRLLSLHDARAVKEALLGFFTRSAPEASAPGTSAK